MIFDTTLESAQWAANNRRALWEMLPSEWTVISTNEALRLGFQFKLLGIDWRSREDFSLVLRKLDAHGLMEHRIGRTEFEYRRAPDAFDTLTMIA